MDQKRPWDPESAEYRWKLVNTETSSGQKQKSQTRRWTYCCPVSGANGALSCNPSGHAPVPANFFYGSWQQLFDSSVHVDAKMQKAHREANSPVPMVQMSLSQSHGLPFCRAGKIIPVGTLRCSAGNQAILCLWANSFWRSQAPTLCPSNSPSDRAQPLLLVPALMTESSRTSDVFIFDLHENRNFTSKFYSLSTRIWIHDIWYVNTKGSPMPKKEQGQKSN